MHDFPIDPYLDAISDALRTSPFVLLKAEPGAGKTTRVPQALLRTFKQVLVVQPRRLAARLAAEWVAEQSGQALGQLVGYQIRFENVSSPATRLLFVTEGVLTRKLLQDRSLRDYDVVVLDEFHERHIHTDVALAMLKQVQKERPDLRVLVMSATLDLKQLQDYLGAIPCFDVAGRGFPVALEYHPGAPTQTLEQRVTHAVAAMLEDSRIDGNILVFLSGLSEILSCAEALEKRYGSHIDIIPLTAEMAQNYRRLEQNRERSKVILSTNVAETSVTLPNIKGVIDSGWAKISGYASWSGLPTLERQRVSQASCIQRAGRAGRVAPGVCYRLFSATDFQGRAPFTEPEIRRIDLCQTMLEIQAIFPQQPFAWEAIDWFEAPDPLIIASHRELLQRLGALSEQGFLTAAGQQMSSLPLHPRLARIVLAGAAAGFGDQALMAAILINEGMLLRRGDLPREHGACDVSHQLQLMLDLKRQATLPRGVERHKIQRIKQLYETLRRNFPDFPARAMSVDETAIRKAIFHAFADRVARYRPLAERGPRSQRHYNFCQGRGGVLSEGSVVRDAEWIVAVEARETLGEESGQRCRIEVVSAVDPSWLDNDPYGLKSVERDVLIDEKSGRARKMVRELYGKLLLREEEEKPATAELAELLQQSVRERWPELFNDKDALDVYHVKLALLTRHGFEHKLPHFSGDYLELLIAHLCDNARSLNEVAGRSIAQAIEAQLDYADLRSLHELCPQTIELDNGRRLSVHYQPDSEPWIEAKIQEFFGQSETPRICRGRQPLLLKLLAPNRRPAQITQDLRGFWLGSYQLVKKELKRRYPKHAWPDDPLSYKPVPKDSKPRPG